MSISTAAGAHASMQRMRACDRLLLGCCLLAACTSGVATIPPAVDPCADLFAAAPHEWSERMAVAHALGADATPRLLALLQDHLAAPGAPAAVCLLGRLGGPGVTDALSTLVADRSSLATEAALALGELRADSANAVLRACVDDASADASTRTAAACALVRCGAAAAAIPMLTAVLLAGSPDGADKTRALGLPERPRWALERYMVQRLLAQEGATELALALDPDASWPALAAVTQRIAAWLAAR